MSGEPVFLVPVVPPPGRFLLDGAEARHAAVKRLRPGEPLILSDGRGSRAAASVLAAGRDALAVQVGAVTVDPEPAVRVLVVQALPKGERSELAVDLATQAGADEIVPWQAARCVARWAGSPDKAARGPARWQATAREAAKQSRRSRVPAIRPLATTAEVARLIGQCAGALVLHEAASVPLASVTLPVAGDVALVVGPEGGITPAELDRFEQAGAVAVRLGREVLRTSTAAAVALGALGVLAGRWW